MSRGAAIDSNRRSICSALKQKYNNTKVAVGLTAYAPCPSQDAMNIQNATYITGGSQKHRPCICSRASHPQPSRSSIVIHMAKTKNEKPTDAMCSGVR